MSVYSDDEMRRYLEGHLSQEHGYRLVDLLQRSLSWLADKHMTEHGHG